MAQVKVFIKDENGNRVPLECPECKEHREGAPVKSVTIVLLSCPKCGFKDDRGTEHWDVN